MAYQSGEKLVVCISEIFTNLSDSYVLYRHRSCFRGIAYRGPLEREHGPTIKNIGGIHPLPRRKRLHLFHDSVSVR